MLFALNVQPARGQDLPAAEFSANPATGHSPLTVQFTDQSTGAVGWEWDFDSDTPTIYEDAEDGTTNGWTISDNDPVGATITNVVDDVRPGRVIQVSGSTTSNSYRLRSDNGTVWANSTERTIRWSMRYSQSFTIYVNVNTTAGQRYLTYTPVNGNDLGSGTYAHHGLGTTAKDGQWHTFTRDLQADLQDAQPGAVIRSVNGFLILGSGRVDDIKLLY